MHVDCLYLLSLRAFSHGGFFMIALALLMWLSSNTAIMLALQRYNAFPVHDFKKHASVLEAKEM